MPTPRLCALSPQSDLRVLDPIWTTAYITRNHGYMVFDTLFAIDAEFAPHPQMVGEHAISPDKLTYQFKLRDGLGFHDGQPVRGVDCVASVKRWMARDGHGQALAGVFDEIKAGRTTRISRSSSRSRFRCCSTASARYRAWRSSSCRSGSPRPTHFSRSPRWSGRARSNSSRRVRTGPPGRLRQEHRLCAAQRAAELGLGR